MTTSPPTANPVFWGWVSPLAAATPNTLQLLTRLRRGDDLASMAQEYPHLTPDQLGLARHLQAQEAELNHLYQEIQRAEARKLQLERDFTQALLQPESELDRI
jgi:hypothetical protein